MAANLEFSPGSMSEDSGETPTPHLPGPSGRSSLRDTQTPAPTNDEKICKICGDRAIGYNFGVVSCESCKAFFRRNACKTDEIRCPFSNDCAINAASRRFCQACRLQKCFDVGMKRDWLSGERRAKRTKTTHMAASPANIETVCKNSSLEHAFQMLEEDSGGEVSVPKELLRKLIRKSKAAGKTECECRCRCGFYSPETRLKARDEDGQETLTSNASYPNRQSREVLTNDTNDTEDAHVPKSPVEPQQRLYPLDLYQHPAGFPISLYNSGLQAQPLPQPATFPQIPRGQLSNLTQTGLSAHFFNTLDFSQQGGNAFYAIEPFIASTSSSRGSVSPNLLLKMDDYSRFVQLSDPQTSWRFLLLPEEQQLLQELVLANGILKQPLELSQTEDLSLMQVVKITDLALRRIIYMAKELRAFKKLSTKDQMNLIKGGCSELLILRGAMAFDPTKNVWNHQMMQGLMEVKLEVLKDTSFTQHYDEHKKFLANFSDKLRKNENVMLIMTGIILFTPSRPHLEDVASVRAVQAAYMNLLRRYLETEYSPTEAKAVFEELNRLVIELSQLNRGFVMIYSGLDPRQLDPLLLELFDLSTNDNRAV